MKTRSSASTDGGSESPPDPDIANTDTVDSPRSPNLRASPTRSRATNGLDWKHGNGHANGFETAAVAKPAAGLPPSSSPAASPSSTSDSTMALAKTSHSLNVRRGVPSLWSMSILTLFIASLGVAVLLTILYSLVTRQLDPKGCRMSYMRPSYLRFSDFDTEHTRFATKYSLYLYREQGVDDANRV